MSMEPWKWTTVNGLHYLWDPNTGALYDVINLFPSGYTYADGTWTFQKQPPPLTRTMKDSAIVEYMKHPKKRQSGESWPVYWHKRSMKTKAQSM